jgi:hypothetical protein
MTPKKSLRAVNRRARQNKAPNVNDKIIAKVPTTLWSVRSGVRPGYGFSMIADNLIFKFVQTLDSGTVLTSSAGADVFYSTAFIVSSLTQWSSFAAIFDQVKLDMVEFWLTPTYQDTAGGASNSRALIVIDYDDDIAPTNTNALIQYTNCIDTNSYNGVYRRFAPHTQSLAGPSGSRNLGPVWFDVASASGVKHFGLKMGAYASSVTTTWNLSYRLHVSFRNVF